ncbi:Signal transduction histidine kinase CheA [hydrothermal vent metagenome]|uniref:Chemotaxis protein CheA n=1 Tax=hydrothermal vent metagenome TaxID=652676 RepID=A0A3B0Z313_9ZZZZ
MTIDLSQFKQTFIEESLEGLDIMESTLLNLDVGEADLEAINTIFRAAHSIKGGSGTFGFNDIASFTHVLETLLDQTRAGEREVTAPAIELLLASVDCLREMINALQDDDGSYDEEQVASVQEKLETMLHGDGNKDSSTETITAEADSTITKEESSQLTIGWLIKFAPHPDMLRTGNDPVLMFRELEGLGSLEVDVDIESLPGFENLLAEDACLSWEVRLTTDATKEQIEEIFSWVDDECDLEITALTTGGEALDADTATEPELITEVKEVATTVAPITKKPAKKTATKRSTPTEATSIRVGTDKVDALINLVGELVITQSMLSQLGEEFDMSKIEKLRNGLAQLERNTREMQENVLRIRMLPISFSFNRFPRLVHDLTQKMGKKVDLKMSGEQTELDKTVMEKIGDPLVHLVRNALDHGIESPEERIAAGKDPVGTLQLNAYHKGGNIIIEISDDGAGINKQRVLDKAVQSGIINSADEMSDDAQIFDLIFAAGFSTADVVSDVSGRGVGMDVVKKNIKALGGAIEITSQEGKGSTFSIRLPLTLAILDGQLVRVGEEVYIIPLISIVESLQIDKQAVNRLAGKSEVYRLRDDYISIIRLYNLFGAKPDSIDLEKGLLVVVEGDGQKVGLFVDDLLGQQQVVIKSLESNFKQVDGVSGATILGDGTVALIMDIGGLIDLSNTLKKDSSDGAVA